jgi:hypothetical protein
VSANAERLRHLRAAAAARGLCYTCRARAVRAGARYCQHCIDIVNRHKSNRRRKRTAEGACAECGGVREDLAFLWCVACRDANAEARALQILDGYCERCAALAKPGHGMCERHLEDARERTRQWRETHRKRRGA